MEVSLQAQVEIYTDSDNEVHVKTSRSTQVSRCPQTVLITASKEELMQRINSFTRFKRKQVDISNLLQYSHHTTTISERDQGESSSCARVDTQYCNRSITRRHVQNTEGPIDGRPTLRDQLWAELVLEGRSYHRPAEVTSQNVLMLEKRVKEMEDALDPTEEVQSNTSLLQRIRDIETRLLSLEGTSHEYRQLSTS